MYGDYAALDSALFLLPLPRNHVTFMPSGWALRDHQLAGDRLVEGLGALLLNLKRRPVVRYQRASELCKRVAEDLHRLTHDTEKALFDFGAKALESPPVVLILDRKDDPVTPLLMQWTYQAMIHELIGAFSRGARLALVPHTARNCFPLSPSAGIHENRVDLRGRPKVHESQQEVVLAAYQDEFFEANMFSNYGEIGVAVKGEFRRESFFFPVAASHRPPTALPPCPNPPRPQSSSTTSRGHTRRTPRAASSRSRTCRTLSSHTPSSGQGRARCPSM